MTHKIIILLFSIFICISCTEQDKSLPERSDSFVYLNSIKHPDYQPHLISEALDGNYDGYLEFFEGTDYEIGISSAKNGGLPGGSMISCISGISQVQKVSKTKIDTYRPPVRSFVDGVELSEQSIISTKGVHGITNCFGKNVRFTFNVLPTTKTSVGESGEVEMYVPQAIEFLFPYAESEEDLNPLCYYKDFIIRWNKDENNINGVLVVVDWSGSMVLGNDISDAHVRRVAVFPDTGEALLPESLFDGIPDTAHCELLILRGNIENLEQNQYSYKIIGKTHHMISFILIREIEK